MKRYKDYIVFVLGADNFYASQSLREIAKNEGVDIAYEKAKYLAKKFYDYDDKYWQSEYSSLCDFLEEYDIEINNYLKKDIEF